MRRWSALGLLCAILLSVTGCMRAVQEGPVYQVYYLSESLEIDQALVAEVRALPEGSNPVEGLLTCLLEGPEGEGLISAIPAGVTLKSWQVENGLLRVDFSSRYASLSGIELTLADYSVVQTLTQLDDIESVEITADGDVISYRDHQSMTAGDTWRIVVPEDTAE